MRLLLIRHGLSTFNKDGRIQGRNDLSILSNDGISQAIEAGKALSTLPIKAIYSSPLKRAKETTEIILEQIEPKIKPIYTENLLEVDLGPWS